MDNELFELCKEVYKRTDWGNPITDFRYGVVVHWEDGQMFAFPTDELDIEEYVAPLYTSDYLLEKLPVAIGASYLKMLRSHDGSEAWTFYYAWSNPHGVLKTNFDVGQGKSDTPLKALLKLVIALDDAGELK